MERKKQEVVEPEETAPLRRTGQQAGSSEPKEVKWAGKRQDLDLGVINEGITKFEFRTWKTCFDYFAIPNTENGAPTEQMLRVALYRKLDAFWLDRLTLTLRDPTKMKYDGMIAEIERTLEIMFP